MEIWRSAARLSKLAAKLFLMCIFVFPRIFSEKELKDAKVALRSQS